MEGWWHGIPMDNAGGKIAPLVRFHTHLALTRRHLSLSMLLWAAAQAGAALAEAENTHSGILSRLLPLRTDR